MKRKNINTKKHDESQYKHEKCTRKQIASYAGHEKKAKSAMSYRTPVGSPAKLSMRFKFCSSARVSVSVFLGGVGGGFARTEEGIKAMGVVFCVEAGEPVVGAFAGPFAFPWI